MNNRHANGNGRGASPLMLPPGAINLEAQAQLQAQRDAMLQGFMIDTGRAVYAALVVKHLDVTNDDQQVDEAMLRRLAHMAMASAPYFAESAGVANVHSAAPSFNNTGRNTGRNNQNSPGGVNNQSTLD